MKIVIVAVIVAALLAVCSIAFAEIQTYIINGRMVTCVTTGTVTNCF